MRTRHDPAEQKVQAVLWDLDGTLVKSEHLHLDLEREVLASFGVEIEAEAYRTYVGTTTRAAFTHLLGLADRGDRVEEALAMKRSLAPDRIIQRSLPTRGVEDVLRDIPMRTHRFALVTSAERYVAEGLLDRFGWSWRFETVVTADDVDSPKPDPQPYLLAAERLGIAPDRTLAVEDAPNGIRSARSAGCHVAALPGTFGAESLGEAHFTLSNLGAVIGLLGLLG